ncbi:GATA zinc finger domain-containing protein 10 [Drosophila takahashii]|uniref:GATA zinc finger domain-containing protein 10 n=1 Tax=Drosophila takahashii TaxID=29030 RepID=UPI003898E0D6
MKLKAVKIPLLFAFLGFSYIQAVVVGPQQLHNNNKNGYRYNGPAHKYLPSEEPLRQGGHLYTDLGQDHRQQSFNGPYSSQYYEGQQQHHHQQKNGEPWQSVLPQQQNQNLGNNQQPHQNSGHQTFNAGSVFQQHHGLEHEQQSLSNKQQYHQDHQLKEHLYEPSNFQQQQAPSHQQQRKESWNSVQGQQHPEQHDRLEGESWQSSQGHAFQQGPHEHLNPQQQHQQHRFEQQQPLRGDLWQPIRELGLEKLPSAEAHANSHTSIAAPGRDVKLVPSYTLSSDLEHDRFIGLDALDTRLLTQSLPDAYRKQLFSSPSVPPSSLGQRKQHEQQLADSPFVDGSHGVSHGGSLGGSFGVSSSSNFLQMQSHSYQLPSTHSTHREWPQNEEKQQGSQQQQVIGNRQWSASAHDVSPPYLHSSQPSPSSENSLTYPSRDFQPPYY